MKVLFSFIFAFLFFCPTYSLERENSVADYYSFIENKGQIVNQNSDMNAEVLFLFSGKNFRVQLRKSGYSYEFFEFKSPAKINSREHFHRNAPLKPTCSVNRIDIDFEGANHHFEIETSNQLVEVNSYYLNGREILNVPSFEKVKYKNIYRQIDIEFFFTSELNPQLKYNLILHPGAKLNDIKFLIKGASIIFDEGSQMYQLSNAHYEISESIPLSYYSHSPQENVAVNYKVHGQEISFEAEYDELRTLIIDPVSSLLWATYLGGNSVDIGNASACDSLNNVYVAGYALSTNNIATSGSYQNTIAGSFDAFISKFNSSGTRLWGTYFGGSGFDIAYAMFVQANGNIYITGDTESQSGVASSGAFQTSYGGGIDDVILAKFSNTGQRIWSTYFGGIEHDIAQAITVDKVGDILITGHTSSPSGIATSGAYSNFCNINYDVFVAKFSSSGNRIWGSYYGDSGSDEAYGIAADTIGNAYITGGSTSISYISSAGSFQQNPGGGLDAFLTCFNSNGSMITWATYFGGLGSDFGNAIEVRNSTIFFGGTTTSSNNISSPGAYQPVISSADDSFLAAFTTSGNRIWASYFGGEDVDYINDIFLDPKSNVHFCGSTLSSFSISTPGAYQPSVATNGNYDAYFTVFSASGQKIMGSYYGGEGNEHAKGITLDRNGKLYICGETTSTLGISTTGSHQVSNNGNTDAFLAKFCIPFQPSIIPSGSSTVCTGAIKLSANSGYSNYLWSNGITTNPMFVSIFAPGNYTFSVLASDGVDCSGKSDTTQLTVVLCTAIEEFEVENNFLIYPSPVDNILEIELKSKGTVTDLSFEIISMSGKIVLKGITTLTNSQLNVQTLPPGPYLIRLTTSTETYSKKFIKN